MADDGRRMTDAEFRRLSAKIKAVYQEAYEDIYKKNLEFVKRHERKEAQYRQMMDEGKIAKEDFDAWMRGQVFQGKQWEAKRKQMEATLLHADEMAMDMINGSRLRVFADNANYIGYEIEQHGKIQTSFGLYDINSVKRLLMEEPDLLPPRKVGKDASYQWYNKQIQGAVTQGIIQGEPLTDIAKRIGQTTGERCMNAMLRNARTMHTGAECAGRIEGMHQAQKLGIEVQKQWLATLDGHTRDSHRTLDGQIRDVDKPFDSEFGKIRFPGDATAAPGDVWNCRCTLIYVYPKYPDSMTQRRDNITGEVIEDMTYREWEHWKETGEKPERLKNIEPKEKRESYQYHATKSSSLLGIAENGLKPNRGHVGRGVYLADTVEDALEWTAETSTGGKTVLRVPESFLKDGDFEKWAAKESGYGIAESVFKGTIPLEYIQIKVNDNGDEYDWWSLALFIKNSKRRYSMLSAKAQRKVDKIVKDESKRRG